MVIADGDRRVYLQFALFNTPDCDTSDIFVVIDRRDEHRRRFIRVALGRMDIIDDCIHQRLKIDALRFRRIRSGAVAAGAEHHWAVKLFVRSAQIH